MCVFDWGGSRRVMEGIVWRVNVFFGSIDKFQGRTIGIGVRIGVKKEGLWVV